ncbi:hypothetical protein JCM19294_1243 [Nonlabens tegetincola]|uniref:Uncharacterized protein n=1 Tax=Nonlabens tegetincola TaxID=323273 RepID=A0A090Q1G8_9FLAO|nr:hypothetical protein JCM19294_1243 [Nonlabens tegetincola]
MHFTREEVKEIEKLISLKLKSDTVTQKGIRNKIRRLGFYASDFGLRGGYTVQDFRNIITISDKKVITNTAHLKSDYDRKKVKKAKSASRIKKNSDETYIIDLCDMVLKQKAARQHRFDFLLGDTGIKLPVDAYYSNLNLVIEYYERQHSEAVPHFDKHMTISGVSRGEQRKLYDERRKIELPKNGIDLVIFDYSEFSHHSNKRLLRNRSEDIEVINKKLRNYLK